MIFTSLPSLFNSVHFPCRLHLGDGAAWIALPVHPYSKCGGWVAFDHFAYKAGGHAENNSQLEPARYLLSTRLIIILVVRLCT